MDARLGADVDASSRLIEDHQPRFGRKPFREHHLLLVAAGEEADLLAEASRAQLDRLDELGDLKLVLAARARRSPRQARLTLSRTDCASVSPSALRSSVTKPIPAAIAVPRGADAHRLAVELQRSLPNGSAPKIARASSVRPEPWRPAIPTISPACTSRSIPRSMPTPASRSFSRTGPRSRSGARREVLVEFAADHHPHELRHRHLGGRHRAHPAPSLSTVIALRKLEDLTQAVRDVEHGEATGTQALDGLEQALDLVHRKSGGGLVHDQDARVERQCLGDLDRLLARDGEAAHELARRDRVIGCELGEQRLGVALHLVAVDERAVLGLAAEIDVLGHGAIGQQVELLVDDARRRRAGPPGDVRSRPLRRRAGSARSSAGGHRRGSSSASTCRRRSRRRSRAPRPPRTRDRSPRAR